MFSLNFGINIFFLCYRSYAMEQLGNGDWYF